MRWDRCSLSCTRCAVVPDSAPAVVASFGDNPFAVPAILRFLPGIELLTRPDDYPARPEVMLSFDAASIDRLGALTGPAQSAGELIVLDHHASNSGFGRSTWWTPRPRQPPCSPPS